MRKDSVANCRRSVTLAFVCVQPTCWGSSSAVTYSTTVPPVSTSTTEVMTHAPQGSAVTASDSPQHLCLAASTSLVNKSPWRQKTHLVNKTLLKCNHTFLRVSVLWTRTSKAQIHLSFIGFGLQEAPVCSYRKKCTDRKPSQSPKHAHSVQ